MNEDPAVTAVAQELQMRVALSWDFCIALAPDLVAIVDKARDEPVA